MRKGAATRLRIIEEAAPLYNQRGFAGFTMQDVMEATGLEKGGLYRHFSSKEELAVEAFRLMVARSAKLRMTGLEVGTNAVDRLRCVVTRFVEGPSGTPGGCALLNTAVDADDGNEVLRELVRLEIAAWRGRLVTIVEQGMAAGEIRRGTRAGWVANTMIGTLEGALMISRVEGTGMALQDARVTLEMVLEGIRV
jgi:AcrR family transcriptional regulator